MRHDRTRTSRSPVIEPLEARVLLTTLPAGFQETLVASGLGDATAMDVLPDGRVLVSVQEGSLEMIPANGGAATTALTLTVDDEGERGLIGVTHDPKFNANHLIYLYHAVPATGSAAAFNEVTRFRMTGNFVNPSTAVNILKLNDLGAAFHNGGSLHFGTDGKLYIGVGENTISPNSQTLTNLLGKILRIDVSRIAPGDPVNDVAKLIPADNPFVHVATGINKAIYALGLRNPFTFAVNANGTIFVDDVGGDTWEEIDQLKAGGNYGWSKAEGFHGTTPVGLGPGRYVEPILAYNHDGGPAGGGSAIIGGLMYEAPAGAAHPFPTSFDGKYFYADLQHDWIRVFDPAKPGNLANPDTAAGFATNIANNPVGLTMAPDGGIYYLVRNSGGELLKISSVPTPPMVTRPPASISATVGQSARFTVAAVGPGPLHFQWQRRRGGVFMPILGATASSLILGGLKLADSGSMFRVIVRNASGAVVSAAATLTVSNVQPHDRALARGSAVTRVA